MNNTDFDFHVAISFAGENRDIAQNMAEQLKDKGVKVFYDNDFQDELWGKDGYTYLSNIYSNRSFFVIPLISKNYEKKVWPRHEIKNAFAKALHLEREYILPVKIDDTEIFGIPSTIGYLDLRQIKIEKLVALLCQKLENFGFELSKNSKNDTIVESSNIKRAIFHKPNELVQQLSKIGIGNLGTWKQDIYSDTEQWYSLTRYFDIQSQNGIHYSQDKIHTLEGLKEVFYLNCNIAIYLESEYKDYVEELKVVLNINNPNHEKEAKTIFADVIEKLFRAIDKPIPIGLINNISKGRACLFEIDTFQVELLLNVSNIDSWELIFR